MAAGGRLERPPCLIGSSIAMPASAIMQAQPEMQNFLIGLNEDDRLVTSVIVEGDSFRTGSSPGWGQKASTRRSIDRDPGSPPRDPTRE